MNHYDNKDNRDTKISNQIVLSKYAVIFSARNVPGTLFYWMVLVFQIKGRRDLMFPLSQENILKASFLYPSQTAA